MVAWRLIFLVALAAVASFVIPAEAANEGRIATLSSIVVDDAVDGDVVTIGGDIELRAGARISGHVVAIFGSVVRREGALVEGRVLAVRSLASLTLEPEAGRQNASLVLAVRLLTVGGWLLVTTLLALLFPYRLRYGAHMMNALGIRVLVLGATAFVTLIAALVAMLGLGPSLGVPLAIVVILAFLAAKAVGLAVLGAHLGSSLFAKVSTIRLPLTVSVFIGVSLMVAVRFIPLVGGVIWTGLSVAALGAGLFVVVFVQGREEAPIPVRSSGPSPR